MTTTITDIRRGARSLAAAAGKVRGGNAVHLAFSAVAASWTALDLGLVPLEFLAAAWEMCGRPEGFVDEVGL